MKIYKYEITLGIFEIISFIVVLFVHVTFLCFLA